MKARRPGRVLPRVLGLGTLWVLALSISVYIYFEVYIFKAFRGADFFISRCDAVLPNRTARYDFSKNYNLLRI